MCSKRHYMTFELTFVIVYVEVTCVNDDITIRVILSLRLQRRTNKSKKIKNLGKVIQTKKKYLTATYSAESKMKLQKKCIFIIEERFRQVA